MSYKDLIVDKNILKDSIQNYVNCNVKHPQETESRDRYEIICKKTNRKCNIHIAHKSGGKTTIWSDGRDKDTLGQEIINYAVGKAKVFKISNINNTILVDEDDFNKILQRLQDENDIERKEISGGIQYTYKGNNKQKFVFKYYSKSKKLHLQGLPIPFFGKILSELNNLNYNATETFLSDIFEADEFQEDTIDDLFNNNIPKLHPKLPSSVKKIISPSLIFIKVNVVCDDYAFLIYPALRTMEYVLKEVLEKNGFELEDGNFSCFGKYRDRHILKGHQVNEISVDLKESIEKCYNHYYEYRHSLFHMDNDISTIRRIENRDDALSILFGTFDLMEGLCDGL